MEPIFIYLVKSIVLLALFYTTYYFLLRKNTFFSTNRWFFLVGIGCSVLLPLITFQKTVWVEPEITSESTFEMLELQETPMIEMEVPEVTEEKQPIISFELILTLLYGIGVAFFLLQLIIELYSLRKIIAKQKIVKKSGFEFIEVDSAIAPFSFFNKIVYNSALFQSDELYNIIEHEKVHAKQLHSLDVLVARLQCILFWFNPLVWMYKKAMIQNLEFIADYHAMAVAKDKKSYLLTLLKITTAEKQVGLTNHFYQSLIKKRIVMLHKKQSKKHHSWNYFLVLPALIFFMITYQVEVVAQVKENPKKNIKTIATRDLIMIESTSTDQEITDKLGILAKEHNLSMSLKKIKRDRNGAMTAIKIILSDKNGTQKVYDISSSEPIKPFTIYVDTTENKTVTFGFGDARAYLLIDENLKNQRKLDSIVEVEKTLNSLTSEPNTELTIVEEVNATTTDEDLQKIKKRYKMHFNMALIFNEVYRNNDNKITTIDLTLLSKSGTSKSFALGNGKPIKPFTIFAGKDASNQHIFGFDTSWNNLENSEIDKGKIEENGHIQNESTVIINKKGSDGNPKFPENTLFILNGKVISEDIFRKVEANTIKSVTVIKQNSNKNKEHEKLFEKYGKRAENGIILVATEEVQKPVTNENSGWGMDYKTSSSKDNIELIKESKEVDYKKALITLNGKEITAAEIEKIDPQSIASVSVFNSVQNKKFIEMYGEKAKHGIILIEKNGYVKPTPVDEEQTEVIATKFKLDPENGSFTVHKRSGKDDFEFYQKYLATIGINLKVAGIERNAKGLITSIKFKIKDELLKNGKSEWKTYSNPEGIPDVSIGRRNGKLFLNGK